jgi:DNA modification methylase
MAGVHRDTLLRWLRSGRVPEPGRDRNGWRVFTAREATDVVRYAEGRQEHGTATVADGRGQYSYSPPYGEGVAKLSRLDWDFADARTGYLTHSIHPYPAKFIPQIPNALIQELSSVGETILDPFCGSGTSLVESLRLGRHAVGVDANPLACLISLAKTTPITDAEADLLRQLAEETAQLGQQASMGTLPLFPDMPLVPGDGDPPKAKGIEDWFDEHVIEELSYVKHRCLALDPAHLRHLALTAMSSIVVAVSRQDSETRYVRREKNTAPGDTLQLFSRALTRATEAVLEFADEVSPQMMVRVHQSDVLQRPDVGPVDLVVCSPPYPNAFSYHLYHRTRMLWLDMDQPTFKRQEIGSHRKYSRKGPSAATADTFRSELRTVLSWLRLHLRPNRHACFVIGDSIIKGRTVCNAELLAEIANSLGFKLEARISRRLQDTKKYFNPAIGRIKDEYVVVLRSSGGANAE